MKKRLFTSESVTEGHPDKIADQVSDAVLDAILTDDATGKVACETMVTTGLVLVAGEITTTAYVDIPTLVRGVVKDIGYTDAAYGFDYETCSVLTSIDEQSPDIAMGVVGKEGAGDQGMMFGYACRDTDVLMPLPIFLAHRLSERLAAVRKSGEMPYLRPDGKTQVTVEYVDGVPRGIDTVVLSTQHDPDVKDETLKSEVRTKIVDEVLGRYGYGGQDYTLHVNPTGRFVEGGPKADCGLTGRKIIVDTYGGMASHGGGAFSGKDPTKVDRSACYAVRHIAKNIVAAGLAERCNIQVAYAIGEKDPVSVLVETLGTGSVSDEKLTAAVRDVFDLTPKGIIERLDLRRGVYRQTAAYGHFGREGNGFTWEKTDFIDQLKSKV